VSAHIPRSLAAVAVLTLALASSARATWYGENVAKGSDIMMMDVRWPWWPESTYFANWNFATSPTGIGGYGGFTGGVPSLGPDHRPNLDAEVQAAFRPGSVWSFWGSNKEGEPVRVAASSEYTYPRQYIGEGASGSLGGPVWPFIRQNRWYTMMMRVWEPAGVEHPQCSYIGRWVKDVEGKQWHLYGIMRLPVPATSFNGNAGFLEDFGNGGRSVRSLHRRLGYCRKDGKWLKSDTVTYDVPPRRGELDTYWIVNTLGEGDHEVLAMELSANRVLLPQKLHGEPLELGKSHAFTVRQPDLPTLDKPKVKDVKAESNGKQVVVSWAIPDAAPPQFAYRIEVFDNRACQGQPLAVREERMPTVRTALLQAATARPTVRLSVTDVFDQPAGPVVVTAEPATAPAPATVAQTQPGLDYEFLVQDSLRQENYFSPGKSRNRHGEQHHWLSLAELSHGRRIQSGIARGFDTELRGDRNSGYAFKFRGLLRVPADGLYVLYARGSDGYRIVQDGRPALAWDGPHGPAEKTAVLNLARGDHSLAVDYFVDQPATPFFSLEWEGPGLPRQEIPAAKLSHADDGRLPRIALTAKGGSDGAANIAVQVDPRGHEVTRTLLFLGKLQIAESNGPQLNYSGLMPEGESTLWARLVFDRDHTLDSEPRTVTVTGPAVQGWNLGVAGEAKARRGVWQTGPDSFSFLGDGEYVLSRRIQGDFTLSCRIDAYAGARGEPVNADCWVGLTAREDASRNNYQWGREFGLMQTGRDGLRTTPNHSDLGGGRISDYALPQGRPWLRIVRQGNQWTAWTSADGTAWEHEATHFIPTRQDMDAGLVFRALPQDARAYFQAKASHLTLQPGVAKDVVMPAPQPATNTAGPRLTGVALAHSDANIVVLRSSDRGLLRSTDGGRTWTSANGNLRGAANSVRSVAIHPQDARIMLRAAGHAGDRGVFEGGLMLTRDGGQNWKELDFPGDFDGEGPSALCGEVVAFDPANPDIIFAGCETKGFFRSGDGGASWKLIGAAGERITAISANRWVRGRDGLAYLHVVTCPDAWMPLLGRGKPALAASVKTARSYVSHDGGASLHRTCERGDLGYLNVAFDKGSPSEPPYATTHGILHSLSDGERTFLFPLSKNVDGFRPVTALACSGIDDGRCGRCLTMPLNPAKPGRLSRSDFFAFHWNWLAPAGDRPAGGMISVCGEFQQGRQWWLLATDGLYHSTDGGDTLTKVLDEKGRQLK
jgi:hypothetical protein